MDKKYKLSCTMENDTKLFRKIMYPLDILVYRMFNNTNSIKEDMEKITKSRVILTSIILKYRISRYFIKSFDKSKSNSDIIESNGKILNKYIDLEDLPFYIIPTMKNNKYYIEVITHDEANSIIISKIITKIMSNNEYLGRIVNEIEFIYKYLDDPLIKFEEVNSLNILDKRDISFSIPYFLKYLEDNDYINDYLIPISINNIYNLVKDNENINNRSENDKELVKELNKYNSYANIISLKLKKTNYFYIFIHNHTKYDDIIKVITEYKGKDYIVFTSDNHNDFDFKLNLITSLIKTKSVNFCLI